MPPHSAPNPKESGSSAHSVFRFLLPLFLSILPWFILQSELPDAQARLQEDARRQWLEQARLIARRLPEVTTFHHWVEEGATRLARRIERRFLGRPSSPALPKADVSAIEAILGSQDVPEVPIPLTWMTFFAGNGDAPDPAATPSLLGGKGLQAGYRAVFANLLRDIARECGGLPNSLHAQSTMNRLQQCFGDGVSPRLFDPAQEGRAFDVIWQRNHALAVWRLLRRHGKVIGGAFFVYPSGRERFSAALKVTFRRWKHLFAGTGIRPAFVPIPTAAGPSSPLTARGLNSPPAQALIQAALLRIRVQPGKPLDAAPPGEGSATIKVDANVGTIRLPILETAGGIESQGWMVLPCSLHPLSGHLALLLGKVPVPAPLLLGGIARGYGFALLIGWSLFLAMWATGRSLPRPGVRMTFLLWFVALAGTPVALMLGAGERLQFDLSSNRRTALDEELARLLRQAELGSRRGANDFRLLGHRITTDPRLLTWVRRSLEDGRVRERFLDHLFTLFKRKNLEPYSIIFMAPGKQALCRIPPSISPDLASSVLGFQQIFANPILNQPGNAEAFTACGAGHIGSSHTVRSSPEPTGDTSDHISGYAKGSPAQMLIGNFNMVNTPDTLIRARLGNRQSFRYYNFFRKENRSLIFATFDCGVEGTYEAHLRRTLHELHLRHRSVQFAVYRKTPNGVVPLVEAGDTRILQGIRRDLRPWGLLAEADGDRRVILTSPHLPEYLLVAATSLTPLQDWLWRQTAEIALALILALGLLLGCAWVLAEWLTPPITAMTEGLKRVAAQDLTAGLPTDRTDELGEACGALNTMIERLRERQMMSRFVAPQVLEVVADGDIDRACAGSEREVALLVSDIRSFTTLSETHPPGDIFALLNRHFQAMTPIIQKHGGAIDRFIGDAVQAVFYPGIGASPTARALQAAIEMRAEHLRILHDRKHDRLFPYEIGIGLEVGSVVTGVLGDPDVRLDFTVLGEAMKRAAELESRSRFGHASRIVVSEAFRARLDQEVGFDPIIGPGESGEIPAWEFIGAAENHPHRRPTAVSETTVSTPAPRLQSDGSSLGEARHSPSVLNSTRHSTPGDFQAAAPIKHRTAEASRSSASRNPRIHIALFASAWMIPIILVAWAFSTLLADDLRRREEAVKARLDDDLHLVEQSLEPRTLVTDHIRRCLQKPLQKRPSSIPFTLLDRELTRGLNSLEQELPGLGWYIFAAATAANPLAPTLKDFQHPGLVSKGGDHPLIGSTTLDIWFREMMTVLGMPTASGRGSRLGKEKEKLLGRMNFDAQHQLSWGSFVDLPLYGKPRLFCWFPIIAGEFSDSLLPIAHRHRPLTRSWEALIPHMRGMVFLFLPAGSLDQTDSLKRLIPILARYGARLAILPPVGTGGGWQHPDFRRVPELRQLVQSPPPSHALRDSIPNWRVVAGEIVHNDRWRILFVRPFESATGSGHGGKSPPGAWAAQSRRPPRFAGLSTGLAVLAGLWGGLGFLAFVHLLLFESIGSLSLRRSLAGAFFLTLLPTFTLGIFVLERASHEQRARLLVDQKRRLSETITALDEGRQLFLGWATTLLNRATSTVKTISVLDRQAAPKSSIPSGLTTSPQPNPADVDVTTPDDSVVADISSANDHWMSSFYWGLARLGLRVLGPLFNDHRTGKNRFQIEYIRGRASEARYWRHLFRYSNSLTLQRLVGITEHHPGDLKLQLMTDEMWALLRIIFPPDHFAQLLSGPLSITDLMFFANEQEYLFRSFIGPAGKPRYSFISSIPTISLDIPFLRNWYRAQGNDSPERIFMSISPARTPERCFHPPFARYKLESAGQLGFTLSYDHIHPRLVDLNRLSRKRECGVFGVIGTGTALQLCLSQPGGTATNLHFTASLRLGELMTQADHAYAFRRLILILLGCLLLILGKQVAHRFLEPVTRLVEASRSITSGDLTHRLPLEGAREFLALATAFNAMAQGVAEGRLLSRFVSDSVRTAARDRDRHSAALAGQELEATILFVGLDGYQNLVSRLPPERLITITNAYLQRMSGVIRRNGGEIDKFIGEKILAVFPADRLGGRERAAMAGLAAADGLLEAMVDLRPVLPLELGVGLVTGPVLAGIVGSPEVRLEYTVIGDTVNLASRLCDVAQQLTRTEQRPVAWAGQTGGTVVEKTTAAAVESAGGRVGRGRFERLALPPIKGKTHAVETLLVRPRVPSPR